MMGLHPPGRRMAGSRVRATRAAPVAHRRRGRIPRRNATLKKCRPARLFKDRSFTPVCAARPGSRKEFDESHAAFRLRRGHRDMKAIAAVMGAAFLVLAARAPAPEPPTPYFFFSLDTPDAAAAVREARRAAGAARFRPVFLPNRRPSR